MYLTEHFIETTGIWHLERRHLMPAKVFPLQDPTLIRT